MPRTNVVWIFSAGVMKHHFHPEWPNANPRVNGSCATSVCYVGVKILHWLW